MRLTKRLLVSLAVFGVGLSSASASAQTEIVVEDGADFVHQRTGITFPVSVAGTERIAVADYGSKQFDVSGQYLGEDLYLTVYLYRPGIADISVNFDMVMLGITQREGFSPDQASELAPRSFQPQGHPQADSMVMGWDVQSGGEYDTGAVALIPHGQWIIKLRGSSSTYSAEDLAGRLEQLSAMFTRIAPDYFAGAVMPVTGCTEPLALADNPQVPDLDGGQIMAHALMMVAAGQVIDEDGEQAVLESDGWCRDGDYPDLRMYRPVGTEGSYVLMESDAGSGLIVGNGIPLGLPALSEGESLTSVIHADADQSLLYGVIDGLPAPAQLGPLLNGRQFLAVTDRDGAIEVNSEALPDSE